MSNIRNFSCNVNLFNYLKPKFKQLVGRGSEGVTYTDGINAYKVFMYDYSRNEEYRKKYNSLITTDDYNLSSFAFPSELYVVDDMLMGTKARYISDDFFKDWKTRQSISNLSYLNFDDLLCACNRMEDEIAILSKDGVELNDVAGNLLFNGTSLVAVDTGFYEKNSSIPLSRTLHNYNLFVYKDAISHFFKFLIVDYPELNKYFGPELTSRTDVMEGISKVKTIVNCESFVTR